MKARRFDLVVVEYGGAFEGASPAGAYAGWRSFELELVTEVDEEGWIARTSRHAPYTRGAEVTEAFFTVRKRKAGPVHVYRKYQQHCYVVPRATIDADRAWVDYLESYKERPTFGTLDEVRDLLRPYLRVARPMVSVA